MTETWQPAAVPDRLKTLEKVFLQEADELLRKTAGGDDEAFWYLSWRLELAAVNRNLVDQTAVRKRLFEEQHHTCPECGKSFESPRGQDVHKRLRMFAKHQGYVPGNVVLLHPGCHLKIHAREPHVADATATAAEVGHQVDATPQP